MRKRQTESTFLLEGRYNWQKTKSYSCVPFHSASNGIKSLCTHGASDRLPLMNVKVGFTL